jgi:hypothetical protein
MIEMKELGHAVAVLVDALVVRSIVLPSLMMLLDRWNWWSGRVPAGAAPAAPQSPELVRVRRSVPRSFCVRRRCRRRRPIGFADRTQPTASDIGSGAVGTHPRHHHAHHHIDGSSAHNAERRPARASA